MSGVPFRGVSSNADSRFSDKEKKLLKSMKFPKEYETKVDFEKLKFEAMKPWIAKRVTELLGIEDEVLVGYVYEQIEGKKSVDPRILQINLTGFLEKNTSLFVKELWLLMASAKDTATGIPQKLLDDKEEEQKRRRALQESINERMAADREKREAERKEIARREAREREERQRQREKERQQEYEREVRRRDKEREERERRRKEAYEKERERELEKRKKWEARAAEERQKDRDRDPDRARDRERDRDRDRGGREKERDGVRRAGKDKVSERHRYPLTERQKRELERHDDSMKDDEEEAKLNGRDAPDSPGSEPETKRARVENSADDGDTGAEPAKKLKKEKKEKKEKKPKKEKKEKKDKSKNKRQSSSRSESPQPAHALLDGRRSLEDDLRRKALLSVKKD